MNEPQTFPGYLPSIDRRLEYQAGLFIPSAAPVWEAQKVKKENARPNDQQWLGEDFSHVIVSR